MHITAVGIVCLVTKDAMLCYPIVYCTLAHTHTPHTRMHTHTYHTHFLTHTHTHHSQEEQSSSSSDESEDDAMEVDHSKLHQKKGTKHDFIRSEEVSCSYNPTSSQRPFIMILLY